MLYPNFDELIKLGQYKLATHVHLRSATTNAESGQSRSHFKGQGLDFEEVRAYCIGDDVRNIDWRVTARTGSPHLKLFQEERERSVIICVDVNTHMRFGTRGTFKSVQAAKVAAILGGQALHHHHKVGTCLFGDEAVKIFYRKPGRTRATYWEMLKRLSLPSKDKPAYVVSLLETLIYLERFIAQGTLVYVISDFMHIDERLEKILMRLTRRSELIAIAVNDISDQNLPNVGLLSFQDGEDEGQFDTGNKIGQKAYTEQWLVNRTLLNQMLRKANVGLISCTTQDDLIKEMQLGLQLLNQRGSLT